MKLFSDKKRPVHLGPYPLELLERTDTAPDLSKIPPFRQLTLSMPEAPHSIANAIGEYQAMLDVIRDGFTNKVVAECPGDLEERVNHLKAFGYYYDASMVGVCRMPKEALLDAPYQNPDMARLAEDLRSRQTGSLAAGVDLIMADLREAMDAPTQTLDNHSHAIVFLYEFPRDPEDDEPGSDWIGNAQMARACIRATETTAVVANYIRVLGYEARSHSMTNTDIDLNKLVVAAGLATVENGELVNPYLGTRFGIGVVTTSFELACDKPLVPLAKQPRNKTHGLAWQTGKGFAKNAFNQQLFAKRRFVDGAHPFEKLKRVDTPTTFIDEARVARVPKRSDMFARAQFGDMGKTVQKNSTNGKYVTKAAPSMAQRRALGALILLQDGGRAKEIAAEARDPQRNADNVKATAYFLGVDAVGISRCPTWAWYSHNAQGEPINPKHDHAISMIIDQGYETMEGSSGDDWIAVSQSMRAYLRFSVLGGVMAQQIRNLGYSARAHTVMDGDVLQPPLLLLSGLGEVSRIGEVILNPYLGPRLKSGVVTTTMPMTHDKPVDFGLQRFCEGCNKCARECPSGAITAGPKTMFNGYEIWKSDSQKCASYRIGTERGAMCGRCMKTCPWNLEGLFAEAPFRWAAMHAPALAPALAALDDAVGNGELNPVKKWWWDLQRGEDGGYRPPDKPTNARGLQKDLKLRFEDQTLAVYPANLAPPPWPYPFPMDREKGIEAYQAMITAKEYKLRLARGETEGLAHEYQIVGESPVVRVEVTKVERMTDLITKYEFSSLDGKPLPPWTAGAHLDIVVAPDTMRQYSMCGDPADRMTYQVGVLREDDGRGGSKLLHRIFTKGRKIFVSKPINHFELEPLARKTLLMGGGIGITPMIAMAHQLWASGAYFELHYSCRAQKDAAFLADLSAAPWAGNVRYHFSDGGTRADLDRVIGPFEEGTHVYTCGPDRYMNGVLEAATRQGFPDTAQHKEYFSVPETPDYVNHPFKLKLTRSGKMLDVPADRAATDVLLDNGVAINVKCSDGICGVCKCDVISGDVEHRDFVLSKAQRTGAMILCQSRAAKAGDVIEVDL